MNRQAVTADARLLPVDSARHYRAHSIADCASDTFAFSVAGKSPCQKRGRPYCDF